MTTSKQVFIEHLQQGCPVKGQSWDTSQIQDPVENDNILVVIAQNGVDFATYHVELGLLPTYAIGDTGPAGGKIFYDKGGYDGTWRYLEAKVSNEGISAWSNLDWTYLGGTSFLLGSGFDNTLAIVSQEGHTNSAASLCHELVFGEKDDWHLPSAYELHNMVYLNNYGEFFDNGQVFWSSSEASNNMAYAVQVSLEGETWGYNWWAEMKSTNDINAICIRQF